jgi:SAM-dependent methyltransferase
VADLDELIAEAEAHPMEGWEWDWRGARLTSSPLPWSYREIVQRLARDSPDRLDLGTGSGEWLAKLATLPTHIVATEGWAPNVARARARLEPLRVELVAYQGPSDNLAQSADEPPLPFADGSFHLVASRHEAFVASEVARVLARGGRFVTQQVADDEGLRKLLGITPVRLITPVWDLELAASQVESASLKVTDGGETTQVEMIADIGALVWVPQRDPVGGSKLLPRGVPRAPAGAAPAQPGGPAPIRQRCLLAARGGLRATGSRPV